MVNGTEAKYVTTIVLAFRPGTHADISRRRLVSTFSPDGATLAVLETNIAFYRVPDGALIWHYSDSAHGSYCVC